MIYSVIQYLFYTLHGCFLPYVTVFLMEWGVDTVAIGLILSANAAVMVLAQVFWGIAADKVGSVKKVFQFNLLAASVLIFIITFVRSTWLLVLLFPLTTFFVGPLMPLIDNWMSRVLRDRTDTNYGKSRLWGSIGFAIMVTFLGRMVESGYAALPFRIYGLVGIITLLLISRIPDVEPEHKEGGHSFLVHFSQLMANRKYVVFVVLSTLVFLAVQPSLGFLPKLIEAAKAGPAVYGVAMAISALSEIPFFYLGSRLLKKYSPRKLLLLSFMFFAARLLISAVFHSPAAILVSQLFQGFGYSIFLITSLVYIDDLASPSCRATAFLLGSAAYTGVSGIAGNYLGGRVIEASGILSLYGIGSFVIAAAALLFALSSYIERRRRTAAAD